MKNFDEELYVTDKETQTYLDNLKQVSMRCGKDSMPQLLKQQINIILDERLERINNKCSTCAKEDTCLIHSKIWDSLEEIVKKLGRLDVTVCVSKCEKYKKE